MLLALPEIYITKTIHALDRMPSEECIINFEMVWPPGYPNEYPCL